MGARKGKSMPTPTRPATGAIRRFPEIYPEVYEVQHYSQPAPGFTLSRETILIIIAALAIWYGLSKAGQVGPRPDPSWAPPPPAQPAIVINDNSWNVDICGVCPSGNAAPHFTVEGGR
jgi:hypothetical protein